MARWNEPFEAMGESHKAEVTWMTTIPEEPDRGPAPDFITTEDLVNRHQARPLTSISELAPAEDPFESDDEYAAFLSDLYASRRADIA